MTAATLSRLPLIAGGTLLGSLGRGGFWTATRLLDLGFWGLGQFMRAPVAVSAVVAVVGLSAVAGANALYFQHERHPAPLFFSPPKPAVAPPQTESRQVTPHQVAPVLPAPRPRLQPAALDSDVTGSIGREPAVQPITTDDIKALQNKLIALKLLDSAADGIYGPHTAVAVRAFESHVGMRPDGRLTPALLAALRSYTPPAPDALAAATPAPAIIAGPIKPVPLAPLPDASAMAIQPAAQPAAPAPTPPAPSVASPSVASPSATAPLAAPAAPVAADAAAASPAPAASDTFAANSSPDGGVAAAPALPPAGGEELAPAAGQGQATPASTASANLTAAQRLAAQFGTLPPAATAAEAIPDSASGNDSQGSTDPALITQIQKGLASLGFLADRIDGVPGEGTAKAIRNFQVFYNYKVTGLATHQLLGLLIQHGATI